MCGVFYGFSVVVRVNKLVCVICVCVSKGRGVKRDGRASIPET